MSLDTVASVIAAEIDFYSIVVFAHVFAAVAGLGITFAYPILWSVTRSRYPRNLPSLFASQDQVGKMLLGPMIGLLILSGLYLVITEDGGFGFDQLFVQVGLPVALYLFIAGPAFFSPNEAKLAELAERDIAASADGEVAWSAEFEALYARMTLVGHVSITLIAIVIFFMTVKP